MKTILFTGLAATALLSVASAAGASDSWSISSTASASDAMGLVANGRKGGGGMHNPGMGMPKPGMPPMAHGPRPGMHGIPKTDVYRRPFRGYVMPRYWVQPSFYIPNYTIYGLSAPSRGYNWSRYYDDAVLTDQRGYVQDYRSGLDWNAGYSGEGAYYDQPDYGPSMRADTQAYDWGDNGDVAFASEFGDGQHRPGVGTLVVLDFQLQWRAQDATRLVHFLHRQLRAVDGIRTRLGIGPCDFRNQPDADRIGCIHVD